MATSVQHSQPSDKRRLLRRYTSMMTLPTTLVEHSVLANNDPSISRHSPGGKPHQPPAVATAAATGSPSSSGKSRWRKLSLTGIVQRLGRSTSSASQSRRSSNANRRSTTLGSDGGSLTQTPPTSGSPDDTHAWFSNNPNSGLSPLHPTPPVHHLAAPAGYRYAPDGRLVYIPSPYSPPTSPLTGQPDNGPFHHANIHSHPRLTGCDVQSGDLSDGEVIPDHEPSVNPNRNSTSADEVFLSQDYCSDCTRFGKVVSYIILFFIEIGSI